MLDLGHLCSDNKSIRHLSDKSFLSEEKFDLFKSPFFKTNPNESKTVYLPIPSSTRYEPHGKGADGPDQNSLRRLVGPYSYQESPTKDMCIVSL